MNQQAITRIQAEIAEWQNSMTIAIDSLDRSLLPNMDPTTRRGLIMETRKYYTDNIERLSNELKEASLPNKAKLLDDAFKHFKKEVGGIIGEQATITVTLHDMSDSAFMSVASGVKDEEGESVIKRHPNYMAATITDEISLFS